MADHHASEQNLRGQIFEVIDAAGGRYDHADADTITDAVMGVVTSDQERRRAYAEKRVEWARRAEADTWQRRMREELEGRDAERDEEIAIRDARIAELFERLDRAHQTTRTALSDLRRARECTRFTAGELARVQERRDIAQDYRDARTRHTIADVLAAKAPTREIAEEWAEQVMDAIARHINTEETNR